MNDDGRGVGDLGGALLADSQLPETKHFLDSDRLDRKARFLISAQSELNTLEDCQDRKRRRERIWW